MNACTSPPPLCGKSYLAVSGRRKTAVVIVNWMLLGHVWTVTHYYHRILNPDGAEVRTELLAKIPLDHAQFDVYSLAESSELQAVPGSIPGFKLCLRPWDNLLPHAYLKKLGLWPCHWDEQLFGPVAAHHPMVSAIVSHR